MEGLIADLLRASWERQIGFISDKLSNVRQRRQGYVTE